jgi:hypothetical protein
MQIVYDCDKKKCIDDMPGGVIGGMSISRLLEILQKTEIWPEERITHIKFNSDGELTYRLEVRE